MYESPIEMLVGKIQTQMDDDILRAAQSYHINVNRDELVKALRYDRDQYNKGYAEGKRDAERVRGEWIGSYTGHKCSVCGFWIDDEAFDYLTTPIIDDGFNYCPSCGAYMKGENNAE